MSVYHDLILDHYRNPRNAGELRRATHHGEAVNLSCGDTLKMDMEILEGIIKDVRWSGEGCAISQAAASLLSEAAKGKRADEVAALEPAQVLAMLGLTLSPNRLKCALLSLETLKRALNNSVSKNV